jgi:hypothetical protein
MFMPCAFFALISKYLPALGARGRGMHYEVVSAHDTLGGYFYDAIVEDDASRDDILPAICQTGWQNGRLLPTTLLPLRSSRTFNALLGSFLLADSIVAATLPTGGSARQMLPTW